VIEEADRNGAERSEMNSYRTRRATVDDLAQLAELWKAGQFPVETLEKLFTDFQVAEDEQGKLAAAIGLHIEGSNGRIHSETFADFALADALRPALWARLQTVAQNHGLFRMWTEEAAPWWKKDAGFSTPPDEILQKLPGSFGPRHAAWLVLRLKEESTDPELVEKELARFKEIERVKRETLMGRARAIRIIGTVLAALVFLFSLVVLFLLVKHRFFDRR
jgi:N-acetylglutamate synthase-like GNAT family acetyltransferase